MMGIKNTNSCANPGGIIWNRHSCRRSGEIVGCLQIQSGVIQDVNRVYKTNFTLMTELAGRLLSRSVSCISNIGNTARERQEDSSCECSRI